DALERGAVEAAAEPLAHVGRADRVVQRHSAALDLRPAFRQRVAAGREGRYGEGLLRVDHREALRELGAAGETEQGHAGLDLEPGAAGQLLQEVVEARDEAAALLA